MAVSLLSDLNFNAFNLDLNASVRTCFLRLEHHQAPTAGRQLIVCEENMHRKSHVYICQGLGSNNDPSVESPLSHVSVPSGSNHGRYRNAVAHRQ